MAAVPGTNCGFLTSAPSTDPEGTDYQVDTKAIFSRFTAPADGTVTEIGWYCANATEAANFQVGIYSHNSGTNLPDARLATSGDVAKGTTAGWKTASVSYSITSGTVYWLALQLDDTATATLENYSPATGYRDGERASQTELTDPAPDITAFNNFTDAIYALYTTSGSTATSINIGDTWKAIDWANSSINIGDTWKAITAVSINIGDTWKTVYGSP